VHARTNQHVSSSRSKSNREIARRLCVSVDTVKTHVQRIMRKFDVTSRAQAMATVRTRS
jgi:DNA-binding CsgD family transcriptional regulator